MHRFILGITDPAVQVDHRDGDGLHNWRRNLRRSTKTENVRSQGLSSKSTSGYKGVSLDKPTGRWEAEISVNGKSLYLGMYVNIKDAAFAYDRAANKKLNLL